MARSRAFSLRDLLRILFRHDRLILATTGSVVLLALVFACLRTPLYESEAQVLVNAGALPGLPPVAAPGPGFQVDARVHELHNELRLLEAEASDSPDRVRLRQIAARAEARRQADVLGRLRSGVRDLVELAQRAAAEPLTFWHADADADDADPLLAALDEGLRIEPDGGSELIDVAVATDDPQLSADLANLLVERSLARHSDVQGRTRTLYDDQIDRQGARLDALESELDWIRTSHNVADLETQKELLLRELARLAGARADAELELELLSGQRRSAEEAVASGRAWLETPAAGRGIGELAALDRLYVELRAERASLADAFAEGSRELQRIDEQLGQLATQKARSVMAVFEVQERSQRRRAQRLGQDIEAKQVELATLNGRTRKLQQLERERGFAERAYLGYRQRAEELQVYQDLAHRELAHVALVRRAVPNHASISPGIGSLVLLGALAGLLLGGLRAMLRELFDHTFQEPERVADVLQLPVLAVIPDAEEAARFDAAQRGAEA